MVNSSMPPTAARSKRSIRTTTRRLADVAEARAADIDSGGRRGRRAFPAWRDMAAADRGRLLLRLADAIEAHADELARIESLDTGHPIRDTRSLDVPRTAATFRYFGGMADKLQGSVVPVEQGFLNYVLREPVGVVGQIVPWNFPIMFTSWKMGPALAAGNCVVLKPAELTPLSSLKIAELMREVGLPAGRRQHRAGLRRGRRPVPRRASGRSENRVHRIDRDRTQNRAGLGRQPEARAARAGRQGREHRLRRRRPARRDRRQRLRRVSQPGTGMYRGLAPAPARKDRRSIPRRIPQARSVDQDRQSARSATEMGPLTSTMHRDRVLSYCKIARDEGGEILLGGKAPAGAQFERGCYVMPTVVRARPTDRVCQEEVFGPFVTVTTFKDESEVIEIANNTVYGLGGGLWTRDLQSRASRGALR